MDRAFWCCGSKGYLGLEIFVRVILVSCQMREAGSHILSMCSAHSLTDYDYILQPFLYFALQNS